MILQLYSAFPNLFKNVQKNVDYLNSLLNEQMQSMIYLETIQNGVLYIYKDFEVLKALNQPLTKRNLHDLETSDFQGSDFFLKGIIDENSFPKDGISIFFCPIDNPISETIELLKVYFSSYHREDILYLVKNDVVEVKFLSFYAIKLYTQRLGRLFEQLMSFDKKK